MTVEIPELMPSRLDNGMLIAVRSAQEAEELHSKKQKIVSEPHSFGAAVHEWQQVLNVFTGA